MSSKAEAKCVKEKRSLHMMWGKAQTALRSATSELHRKVASVGKYRVKDRQTKKHIEFGGLHQE